MKWRKMKLILHCKRKAEMDLEIISKREYFSLVDNNGVELDNECTYRLRYCIRRKGKIKPEKCFPTFQEAKEYLNEILDAAKRSSTQKTKQR